ncbi:hypothetical protein Moror_13668 [Moniliophthora roreri MCA 2997]|uniref:Uncharacterized protein n=2 Tax=Moniliophthora roreri TaxID=221103 RepID=V2XD35_MONRO|nr:hypothetical protein Moror_13668 [Moniliophthora roreri MCA 2997]KAI3600704.1 hypothetical protein WG66_014197 [Moniliophthora roreri]
MSDNPALVFERCWYLGIIFKSIIYGLILYIAFNSICLLYGNGHSRSQQSKIFLILYVVMMVICMTFSIMANALLGQNMWVEHRDHEGGPYGYYAATAASWTNVAGTAFAMFGNFMGDALLLYRCYIIWNSNIYFVILPFLMFLGSTALSIVSLIQSALPGSSWFGQSSVDFAVPWIALTCSLNIIITILITVRLLIARRQINKVLKSKELSQVYTGVIAILVESALPFSVLGIILAALLGAGNTVYTLFTNLWGSYVGLAPLLIIHRVASGKGWSKETAREIYSTQLSFATATTDSTLRDADLEKGQGSNQSHSALNG